MLHRIMVSANSKMADTRSTLLECSLKIRQGRKWKSRWCVLTRQSPVSEEVILKFYKDHNALLINKEIGRERVSVSAHNYCGLEYGYRYPKNIYVLTIVLLESVVLLSFQTHGRLLEWYHKIKNKLPSAAEFKNRVAIPNKGKLPAGRASLYFYNNHFAITPDTPTKLINAWSLSTVIRYGSFNGGFVFAVSSNKGSVNHLLLVENPDYIKSHFDAATYNHLPTRWSVLSETSTVIQDEHPLRRSIAERQRLLDARLFSRNTQQWTIEEARRVDDEEGVQEEEEVTETLLGALADRNSNNQRIQSYGDDQQNLEWDGNNVQMTELVMSVSQTDVDGGANANILSEETVFSNDSMLRTPQKNTPIREQEYEVMASFDHYRSSMHEHYELGSQTDVCRFEGDHQSCTVCHQHFGHQLQFNIHTERFRLDFKPEEREYVNLPSPKASLSNSHAYNDSNNYMLTYLPQNDGTDDDTDDDFSPPSSPPPPPPVRPLADIFVQSGELSIMQRLDPSLEMNMVSDSMFEQSSQETNKNLPVPFEHKNLIKPVGPIARLRIHSRSEASSDLASGSEYDGSSHYSSAASSRHNSFDREPLRTPPPVPKAAELRSPSVNGVLSSSNYRHDTKEVDLPLNSVDSRFRSGSPVCNRIPPPIPLPPKPDHLRGKPIRREPASPHSPSGRPPAIPPRKRCHTAPSLPGSEGRTDRIGSVDEEGDGYLLMKPLYEDKLKIVHGRSKSAPDEESMHSLPRVKPPTTMSPRIPGLREVSPVIEFIPQSPIHEAGDVSHSRLKRSATVGGYVNRISCSPHRTGSYNANHSGILLGASQRHSLTPEHNSSRRTSDISLSSLRVPRKRRHDKYASLDYRSLSLRCNRVDDFKDYIEEAPDSSTATTPFLQDEIADLQDEYEKFAGPCEALSLSPPSSLNSPSQSYPLTPSSSISSLT